MIVNGNASNSKKLPHRLTRAHMQSPRTNREGRVDHTVSPQTARNFPIDSDGLMCKYLPVVAKLECPRVRLTSGNDAPRSRLCVAAACLSQCGETGRSIPARRAAWRIKSTA